MTVLSGLKLWLNGAGSLVYLGDVVDKKFINNTSEYKKKLAEEQVLKNNLEIMAKYLVLYGTDFFNRVQNMTLEEAKKEELKLDFRNFLDWLL